MLDWIFIRLFWLDNAKALVFQGGGAETGDIGKATCILRFLFPKLGMNIVTVHECRRSMNLQNGDHCSLFCFAIAL